MDKGFHFHTQYHLVELLGIKAKNPVELLDGIDKIPASSIYYHTHRFVQQHHYLSPEAPNDFAFWLKDMLHLEKLGEAFLGVNTIHFSNLEHLRKTFQTILDNYISQEGPVIDCLPGYEFHFMASKTFIIPTRYTANNLAEFADILQKVSIHSLYFHMFEARMRLGVPDNDFSAWLRSIKEERLADEISRLDPYNITLDNLRKKIIKMVDCRVQNR